jgi:hypothetical protein
MRHHHIARTAGAAVAVAALAAPGAFAHSPVRQDLRSPDSIDAAAGRGTLARHEVRQDLRGPDAIDAAAGRGTFSAPEVTIVKVPALAPADAGEGAGIQWTEVGIGGGGMLGLLLLGAGGAALVVRRPHRRDAAA